MVAKSQIQNKDKNYPQCFIRLEGTTVRAVPFFTIIIKDPGTFEIRIALKSEKFHDINKVIVEIIVISNF